MKRFTISMLTASLFYTLAVGLSSCNNEEEPNAPDFLTWEKVFDGPGSEWGAQVLETSEGEYYVLTNTPSDQQESDALVYRFRRWGEIRWSNFYGSGPGSYAFTAALTPDDGLIVAGRNDEGSVFLTATDADGSVIWEKTFFSGLQSLSAPSLIADEDGGGYYFSIFYRPELGENRDLRLCKIDGGGNLLWQEEFDLNTTSSSIKLLPAGNGEIMIGASALNDETGIDVWLARVDGSDGSLTWTGGLPLDRFQSTRALTLMADGSYLLAFTNSTETLVSFTALARIDAEGSILWEKTSDFTYDDAIPTRDGAVVLVGSTKSLSGGGQGNGLITKLDTDGNVLWERIHAPSEEDDFLRTILQSQDGGFIATGGAESDTGVLSGVWILKLDDQGER